MTTSSFLTRVIRRPNISCRQTSDFFTFNVYLHRQERLRALPRPAAESGRRSPADPGRVRHGHHPPSGRGASRDAPLAYRKRRPGRAGRNYSLCLDRRMVVQRAGDHRLGVRPGHAGSQSETALSTVRTLFADSESMTRKVKLPTLSEGFGHRLFLQRRQDPRPMPRIAQAHRVSGLRSDSRR